MKRPFPVRSRARGAAWAPRMAGWLSMVMATTVVSSSAPARTGSGDGQPVATPPKTIAASRTGGGQLVGDPSRLPEKVAAMRAAILAAARTGDIEALRTPLEWNEIKPEFAEITAGDPIAHWKSVSADGQGRQILAVLLEILETPPAVLGAGTAGERYVWPGFAEVDLTALPPPLEVMLYRLVSPADVAEMRAGKTWTWWRLSIGADGTWHGFLKSK